MWMVFRKGSDYLDSVKSDAQRSNVQGVLHRSTRRSGIGIFFKQFILHVIAQSRWVQVA